MSSQSSPAPRLALIAAVARNGVIGRDNRLIWSIPEDMKYFRRTTMGCPVLMGRKTFESIGKPLPGRLNIVITRDVAPWTEKWGPLGVKVVGSLEAAIALAQAAPAREIFILGGGEIYRAALPLVDRLYLTEIQQDFEGDAYFPEWDRSKYKEVSRLPLASTPLCEAAVYDRAIE